MHAESDLGHGATFIVELPIVSEDQAAEEQAPPGATGSS
jgi:hypothetical protein